MNPVEAAVVAARRRGIRVDEPRVLKDRRNLVVHLAPSPVVARVAQKMSELRPGIRAHELELTGWLVARGLPVVPPYADVRLRAVVAIAWVTFLHGRHPRLEPMLEWLRRNAP